ncbi:pilus assembly protein PilY [Acinetobacter dispersus]|uniref:PilC/PilY family type IV pilus protein n=1 Tax=Acinetobacter dispersus TaxID=70348 RepID=UPI001F4A2F66|nr:PilC/PilY family type IV pilus protein [Acinetobacter dispersus]MCH7394494.1 pilus assembly protein PilY [Acinetobacter dispersus]
MNKNMKQSDRLKFYRQKLLTMSIAGLCTGIVSTSVTQASDIDIYQEAKSGEISLMFMLDISGSMTNKDGGSTSRIDRLKTAMQDLLNGNTAKGIQKISDDKVIGLSTLGVYTNTNYDTGAVLVPARRLDCKYGVTGCSNMPNNGKTQRQILIDTISGFSASTNTPTARSYAETVAYLMGKTTAARQRAVTDMPYYRSYEYRRTTSSSYWDPYVEKCTNWSSDYSQCNTWATVSENAPIGDSITTRTCDISTSNRYRNEQCYDYTGVINITNTNSGFSYSTNDAKISDRTLYQMPSSLAQTDEIKKCSGQGVYVLTDGEPTQDSNSLPLMQGALGLNGQSFTCNNSSYDCLNNLALTLLDPSKNPASLKFKTAVVGFGSSFNNVASYDKKKTQQQNIDALGVINTDVKRAAYWGIIGEGGWYSGNSSQDVVDSVNAFLGELGTDIPAVTTGSPTVPKDSLNPSVLQKDAYFPQFQPTPDKPYQLWAGNLKKYDIATGILKDKYGTSIIDASKKGTIKDNYDLWSAAISSNQATQQADENTIGSTKFALKGGAWSQLKLKMEASATIESRKLLTNRIANATGFGSNINLRRVTSADLTDTTYKLDANRGYLMLLLGYGVDAANPNTITTTSLTNSAELRQIGAVMHSSPLLVTNKGRVGYNASGILESTNREDYVLFGTTQGLLHVVDAKTGQEKFAFVPNEMVEKQKQAFQKYDTTTGGTSKLYYGVDGPWTSYTEYVIDGSKNLTVGSGKGLNQKGKQIVYGGLRMGGRSYYALNLQDINSPELLFQISPDDGKIYNKANPTGKSYSELANMGQSWSKPAITWVKWGKTRKRVMFVGGGYDAGGVDGNANNGGYETDIYDQTNKIGSGIYMFDAENGELLWWTSAKATNTTTGVIGVKADDLQYSVASEIRTEDRNGDGLADHLYFGDLGGQLFRIDIDNNALSTATFAKTARRLLNLHQTSGTNGTSPRFYEMPAFSIYDYAGQTFAVISIGSGNRSLPLKDYTVGTANYKYDALYNIYDLDVVRRDLYTTTTFYTKDLTRANLGSITQANRNDNTTLVAPYPISSASKQGWYFELLSSGAAGKVQSAKVFSTPLVVNKRLFLATFDGSKPGLSGDCGAGVKGESFLSQFCMPFGQCALSSGGGGGVPDPDAACTSGDGCPLGGGIQTAIPVPCDPKTQVCSVCDPTKQVCGTQPPPPENNKNYCISTGARAVKTLENPLPTGDSKICLVPQRWYERSR